MISVEILEPLDIMLPTDWCRPLYLETMSGGMSDYYSFKNQYSGKPENNVEWCMVKYAIPKIWHNKPIREYLYQMRKFNVKMEFIRGDIPTDHRLDMSEYNTTEL